MVFRNMFAESLSYVVINLFPRFECQVVRDWIVFEIEFSPNNQMNDLFVYAVRPIVIQYLDIVCEEV